MSLTHLIAALSLALSTSLLAGCGSDETGTGAGAPDERPSPTPVSSPAIMPGDPVPPPSGKVVLTLTGVPNTNVGDTLQFDLDTLERLGTVEYTVFDGQALGTEVTFSGPLVRTVLDVAGASGTTMHTVALNDYSVEVPMKDARELPLLLATRADGEPMTVAEYGPTRFVYPTEGYDLDPTVYDPRWIWQLKAIKVS